MDIPLLSYLYYPLLAVYILAIALFLLKRNRVASFVGYTGTAVLLLIVGLNVVMENRLPLFGPFESAAYISLLLSLLPFLPKQGLVVRFPRRHLCLLVSVAVLFILGFQLFQPKAFNPDFYMYDDLTVILFFNLRLVAAALFIYAAIVANYSLFADLGQQDKDLGMKSSRNFMLLAVAIYLSAEWSGSMWCLDWLGDTWQWSKGFFRSSMIFLFVMIAGHIPSAYSGSRVLKTILMSAPAIYIFWMVFHHI